MSNRGLVAMVVGAGWIASALIALAFAVKLRNPMSYPRQTEVATSTVDGVVGSTTAPQYALSGLLSIAVPANPSSATDRLCRSSGTVNFMANFVNDDEATCAAYFTIPTSTFPGSNFMGGDLTIWSTPQATSCDQFAYDGPHGIAYDHAGGRAYAADVYGSVAGGLDSSYDEAHMSMGGRCYEFALEVDTFNTTDVALPISIASITDQQESDLLNSIIEGASFPHE